MLVKLKTGIILSVRNGRNTQFPSFDFHLVHYVHYGHPYSRRPSITEPSKMGNSVRRKVQHRSVVSVLFIASEMNFLKNVKMHQIITSFLTLQHCTDCNLRVEGSMHAFTLKTTPFGDSLSVVFTIVTSTLDTGLSDGILSESTVAGFDLSSFGLSVDCIGLGFSFDPLGE